MRWLWIALVFAGGCGRVGIELLTFAQDNVCVLGVCSNDVDRCPPNDSKVSAGICGCDVSDSADRDGDGTPDCDDLCPNAPDRLPDGSCGCAAASADADGDGTPNCRDQCPYDAAKTAPGVCGCGISDVDSDGDGMPDCADECPDDPAKVVAGKCGCGVPEATADSNGDGVLDCVSPCNGTDDASYVPVTSCGIGYCSTDATPSSCSHGVETACQPGAPKSATDVTCDGVDDNCNGNADEDFAAASTMCGIGACVAQGTLTCVNGKPVDSCTPRNPAINDMTCDGIDDDCDGQLDEDFQPRASTCGTGVCAATGTITCVAGKEHDSCTPGAPTGTDTDCNGIDENCDGTPDDGFVGTTASCGTGACATTVTIMCIDGMPSQCTPGTMAPNDVTCDGVDDNCNGVKDEGYVPVPSMCGVGACARTGQVNCVSGRLSDTCRAGAPAANDSNCNGIDDDCNGLVDDGYVVPTSTCGVGVCQRTGVINCVGGKTQDTCVPGAPTSTTDGPPANGLDDNCNGQVDEDACVPGAPRTYSVGTYANIAVPAGCLTANVSLWGGGGGSGGRPSLSPTGTPGRGGSGGYTQGAVAISGALNLYVGNGGAGCGAGGTNPGSSSYNGGAGASGGFGGSTTGTNGQDGTVAGGGAGGAGGEGNGGHGYYGGGGGGAGSGTIFPPYTGGAGGGGGAATTLLVGSTRTLVAGGGGGGGGANGSFIGTTNGGAGGEGCGGAGGVADGGSGGGGGVCIGTSTRGTNGVPANSGSIPSGRAAGASGNCAAGGGGYATITFSR